MDVLLVGLDDSVFRSSVDSDTQERHIRYAAELNKRTGGTLHMTVHTDASQGLEQTRISESLVVYPSNSSFRWLFALDVLQIGRKICHEHDISLVTTQGPFDDGVAGYLLSRRYEPAFLPQLQQSNLDDPHWLTERRLNYLLSAVGKVVCRRADGVRVVSETSHQWCREELDIPEERLYLNNVLMSMLEQAADPPDVEPVHNQIMYVGRLAKEKGLPYLLHAFAELSEDVKDAQLVLIGDGPERERLQRLAAEQGIRNKTIFEGSVSYDTLPERYCRASIVVLPSLHESFGRVIVEAFGFGTPVVSSDAEGPVELIEDGQTGLLVPRADTNALAEAITELLTNEEQRAEMGRQAREFALNTFDTDRLVSKIVETWIDVGAKST